MSIDSPLCVFWLSSVIYCQLWIIYLTITLRGHHILVNVPLKTTTYPLEVLDFSCLFYCFNTRKSSLTQHGWAAFSGYTKTPEGKEGEKGKEKQEKSGKSVSEKYLLLTEFEVRTVKPWSHGPPSSRKLNLRRDLRWVAKRTRKFPHKYTQVAKKKNILRQTIPYFIGWY